ncbi:helix-turn-helix domain-containing protein [Couchioplanes caeruleus]|uniref:helix-turn-helix domain-containing protein n=1 Tax=Couchioplanes caeruleus TaxID=56438 RepID=UPI0020BFD94A|nr:helix-turn-helix domain-containing protein [Couchioplanes caeruleus]UQU66801.1 helix-turn-helix domain-containing protein [Couchioplanes caeruleus]
MEIQSLTPATQAVLKALAELGQGNVHELAEKSGKARSTTDKAIRTLADAGVIVEVDLGADAAEGTPTRWTLSDDAKSALDAADLSDENAAGPDETVDEPDSDPADEAASDESSPTDDDEQFPATDGSGDPDTTDGDGDEDQDDNGDTDAPAEGGPRTVVAPPRPGDRKVMAIKGVLAEFGDEGATVDMIVSESGISHPTTIRLLDAMQQADAARRLPPKEGNPERWIAGPTKASEVDPNPEPPRCPLCFQVIRGVTSTPAAVAAVQSLIRADGTLHIVGPDDEVHAVKLPTRLAPRTLNTTSSSVGNRSDATANADGNQPFQRGELERLTVAELAAAPGRPMTPQEIATAISAKLGGRNVSSGAVRNNCTKAAAAGTILMVSDAPLTFVFPKPVVSDDAAEDEANAEQTDTATGDGTGDDQSEQTDNGQEASGIQHP